jgi:hypothetical protein
MSYKIFLLLLCLWGVFSYTSITSKNCPAQFDVATANITNSTAAATLGPFLYAGFQNPEAIARVQSIVITGNRRDFGRYVYEMMVPYIIFGSLYVLIYLCIVLCCLFERSCPPCETIRRDLDNDPYSKRETRVCMVFTLFFALGVFVMCMISMSYIPTLRSYSSMASCSIFLSLDTVLNGDEKWGGFVNLRNTVGNITNLLSAAVTQIQIYFPSNSDDWLVDSMQTMQTANLNIYSSFKDSKLITPNPDSTTTAMNAGQGTPVVDSMFIRFGMGPNGTSNTMVTDIDQGLRTTRKVSRPVFSFRIFPTPSPNRPLLFLAR